MLLLRANLDDLELVTASGGASIKYHFSAVTANSSSPPAVDSFPNLGPAAAITTATTTQVIDTSGITSGYNVNVKAGFVRNDHASASDTVTMQVNDGTNTSVIIKVLLLAGELLVLTQNGMWLHYDSNGAIYPSVGNAASQAEMEAGTATDRYVTPQGVNWHPGVCKAWGKAVGNGTSLTVNWNISSISDTATGRLGVNIGTDFSSANYSITASLERSVTSLTATGVEDHAIRNASPAAGSFEIESYDQTAILFAAQDPSNYFWACHGDQA